MVGARRVAGGAIGREMGLEGFDVILRLATLAVNVLVDRAWRSGGKAGDDEARVDAVGSDFDTSNDALDAVPTRRTVKEFFVAPELVWGAGGGEPRRRALLQGAGLAA